MAPYRDSVILVNFIPLSSVAYQFYLVASARGTTYLIGSCWETPFFVALSFLLVDSSVLDEDGAGFLYPGHALFRS